MGEKWAAAVYPLQIVCIVIPLRMLNMVFLTAALGVGNLAYNMRTMAMSAVVMPTAFLIGMRWGVDGLATAWVVAIPIIVGANLRAMVAALGVRIKELLVFLRGPYLAGTGMYLAVMLARQPAAVLPDWIKLVLLTAVGGVAYLLLLRVFDSRVFGEVKQLVSALRA